MSILIDQATTTGAGPTRSFQPRTKTFQASGSTSAGSGAATVDAKGSNDGDNWDTIGTISLTLSTDGASDSFTSDDRYKYHRGEVTSISGTGAEVSLIVGL